MIIFAIVSFIWVIVCLWLNNRISHKTPTYRAATLFWPIYLLLFIIIVFFDLIKFLIKAILIKTTK